ncbi:MAG: hypothetical protein ACJA1A_002645 [Saprospiraceae bacterium]|jgi:hypothetical protein|tara:strand:+ start:2689 stop:3252 length:564 start_codon:yes stop_codon:yes gene_type:complete
MKYFILSLLFLGLVSSCRNKTASTIDKSSPNKETAKKVLSPHESIMAMVGDAHVHIDYSSPGVRGRTIFGKLIPFGKLWRAGANSATSIEINKNLIINGELLLAGKYGVFIIPNQEKWTIIFNTRWDVHGTDKYLEKEDVLRVDVLPNVLEDTHEHLKYGVERIDDSNGLISIAWDKIGVNIPFQVE